MSEQTVKAPASLGILKTIIVGAAGLFYAYGVWNAIAYLVTFAQGGLNGYGWFVLLFSAVFPILIFAAAFALGRRRSALELSVVLLAGLGLVAVFWINVVALGLVNPLSLTS